MRKIWSQIKVAISFGLRGRRASLLCSYLLGVFFQTGTIMTVPMLWSSEQLKLLWDRETHL